MNIAVCIKQVPDTETKVKLNPQATTAPNPIDTTGFKWIISPYDELAIEEALRLKESKPNSTVTVVSGGPQQVIDAIRSALAMGADRGVHLHLPDGVDSHLTAKALAGALKKLGPFDIIFTGKEAIDDGAAQVSHQIAHHLSLPAVTVVLKINYSDNQVECKREVEGGTFEIIQTSLPAVIAVQKGINEPRYPTLPNIVKAKKKEIQTIQLAELQLSEKDQKVQYTHYTLPPPKSAGKKITGEPKVQAQELIRLLREEAKVI